MSLILDALKKSDRERKGQTDTDVAVGEELTADAPRSSRRLWVLAGLFCIAILGAAGAVKFKAMQSPPPPSVEAVEDETLKETEAKPAETAVAEKAAPAVNPTAAAEAPPDPMPSKPERLKPVTPEPKPDVPDPVAALPPKPALAPEEPDPVAPLSVAPGPAGPSPAAVEEASATQASEPSTPVEPAMPSTELSPAKIAVPTIAEPAEASESMADTAPIRQRRPAAPSVSKAPFTVLPRADAPAADTKVPVVVAPSPKPAVAELLGKPSSTAAVPEKPLAAITVPRKSTAPARPSPAAPVRRKAPPPEAGGLSAAQHNARAQAFESEGLFDQAVAEYTQALLLSPGMVEAYIGRAWAHQAKGNWQRAIRNFSRAIDLRPGSGDAYFGRAWAYEQSGQTSAAIADYSKAITRDPDHGQAYFSRGVLHFYDGRMGAAESDFTKAGEHGGRDLQDFALLWKYLSRARGGADSADVLAAFANRRSRDDWPGVLFAMFLGDVDPARVVDATRRVSGQSRRQRECVGFFFLGQYHLIRSNKAEAKRFFERTVATGITSFRQFAAAKVELSRLDGAR